MSPTLLPSVACDLLCACGCTYYINGNMYSEPQKDPFGTRLGWTQNSLPWFVTGGDDDINAAIAGVTTINAEDAVVIAFRGTLPPAFNWPAILDWIQDFTDKPVTTAGLPGKVHEGFLDAIHTILNPILQQVNTLQANRPNPLPLYITGHSKGGGMASIMAAMIYFNQLLPYPPAAVYTFASPHAGDEDFVAGFPSSVPVTRFENYIDIVPFLVPDQYFATALENASSYVVEALGELMAIDESWNYAPLGNLFYIAENSHTAVPLATNPCIPDIVSALDNWENGGLSDVGNAHSHLCGAGYMNGTCPLGVCNI
jgi:Lipase (class 3)